MLSARRRANALGRRQQVATRRPPWRRAGPAPATDLLPVGSIPRGRPARCRRRACSAASRPGGRIMNHLARQTANRQPRPLPLLLLTLLRPPLMRPLLLLRPSLVPFSAQLSYNSWPQRLLSRDYFTHLSADQLMADAARRPVGGAGGARNTRAQRRRRRRQRLHTIQFNSFHFNSIQFASFESHHHKHFTFVPELDFFIGAAQSAARSHNGPAQKHSGPNERAKVKGKSFRSQQQLTERPARACPPFEVYLASINRAKCKRLANGEPDWPPVAGHSRTISALFAQPFVAAPCSLARSLARPLARVAFQRGPAKCTLASIWSFRTPSYWTLVFEFQNACHSLVLQFMLLNQGFMDFATAKI